MENYNLTTISKLLMHFSRNIYRGSFRLLPWVLLFVFVTYTKLGFMIFGGYGEMGKYILNFGSADYKQDWIFFISKFGRLGLPFLRESEDFHFLHPW
jgi:hypothetical protein